YHNPGLCRGRANVSQSVRASSHPCLRQEGTIKRAEVGDVACVRNSLRALRTLGRRMRAYDATRTEYGVRGTGYGVRGTGYGVRCTELWLHVPHSPHALREGGSVCELRGFGRRP